MSEFDVNQILTQMRSLNSGIRVTPSENGPAASGTKFSDLLAESVDMVNKTQKDAVDMKRAFQTGSDNVELPEVMIALQKSSISFEAMKQVRNKLLTAYQEIMNLPV